MRLRRAVAGLFAVDRVVGALGEILSAQVGVARVRSGERDALHSERSVFLDAADGSVSLSVELEPALATLVLGRVLGRRESITATDTPLDPSTRGALAAVLVEAARRAGASRPLRARHDAHVATHDARVDVTVTIDGRPYHVAATVTERERPTSGHRETAAAPGELPIRIPLVVASSLAERSELALLGPGDVWLPGRGWLAPDEPDEAGSTAARVPLERRLLTRAALSPADAERGIAVGRSDAGELVLRGDIIALGADTPEITPGRAGDEAMSATEETLTSMALDAPIVVRVEVGSVTLTARQWGALRPGDVLETGLRLSEPVVLRVAGREVARGELVSIDGELGVRVQELVEGERRG